MKRKETFRRVNIDSKMSLNATLTAIIKVALICLVTIIGMGLISVFIVIPRWVRTADVAVPNLVNKSYQQATQLLYDAGLQLDAAIEKKPSPDIPKGYVIEQSPPANFKVKRSKPVRITLSIGNETIPVPDMTGKRLMEAEAILRNAGFRRGRVAEVHSDRYPQINTVISQTPSAGVMHQRGGAVDLLLSLGARPRVMLMPDLRNKPINEVRVLLKSYGLEISDEEYKPDPTVPHGLIISHTPPAGDLIQVGQAVALEVSGSHRSTTDNGRLVPIRYKVSETGAPSKHVRIDIEDDRRSITVVDDQYQSGMVIDRPPVRIFGDAVMVVYEDGIEVKREKLW